MCIDIQILGRFAGKEKQKQRIQKLLILKASMSPAAVKPIVVIHTAWDRALEMAEDIVTTTREGYTGG